ncbi:MAG: S8 family serine peptidase [Bacteroidota bacterium]
MVFTFNLTLSAQGSNDGYFYVYPKTSQAQPDGNNRSNSAALNSLLDQFGVVSYIKSFPGAPTSSFLNNAYEMHFNGDPGSFLTALYNSDLFSYVDPTGYAASLAALEEGYTLESEIALNNCTIPLAVNDPYAAGPTDPGPFNNRWNIDAMEMECAWSITTGNPDIVIAVVDTEFENDHPDLIGQLLPDWERVPGDELISINGIHHGTTVMADAVATPNNGICIAGTGYNSTGAGYVVPYTGGITAAIWPGIWTAGFIDRRPIINVSWVIIGDWLPNDPNPFPNPFPTDLPTITEAVQLIVDQGSLIVLGAGNDGNPDFLTHAGTPYASIPGVVIATGLSATLRHGVTETRHYAEVDLCAPSRTLNVIRRGTGPVTFFAGNGGSSHSAPFVAGIAALCLDVNPCLNPIELEALLKGTTSEVADASNFPDIIGTGYVNAYQAVLAASEKLSNHTITTDETWDYPRRIEGTLTIQSGAKLTLTSTIACAFDSKIVVEVGGELIIDGGWLRRDCENNKNWKGIEVLGNPSVNQFSSGAQGKVTLNNAIIEHAEIGVSLFRRQTYAQGGGILLADNSTFRNCQNGVAFAKYTNIFPTNGNPVANLSRIEKCVFTLDDDFSFDEGGEHIQLDRVTRINIHNSTLQDERTSYVEANDLQDGIWSSNATFWLTGDVISNMRYGIKAENIKSGRTFRVDDNVFTNNFFGMSVRAVDNFEFTDNAISVGGFSGPTTEFTFPNRQTGLHVDQSSGFFIEDNDFVAAATLPTGAEPVGLAVNNTNIGTAGDLNSETNQAFRNTFSGLYRANVANGENGGNEGFGGFRYFCN